MAYLCDIYTDEDEYEVYLEKLLLHKGKYLSYRMNGQPRETVCRVPKTWVPSKVNILKMCGIESEEFSFSWKK